MKVQFLKATALALLQTLAVHSLEDATVSEKKLKDVAAGTSELLVKAIPSDSLTAGNDDLDDCLDDCDRYETGSGWSDCRKDCECDYGNNCRHPSPNRRPDSSPHYRWPDSPSSPNRRPSRPSSPNRRPSRTSSPTRRPSPNRRPSRPSSPTRRPSPNRRPSPSRPSSRSRRPSSEERCLDRCDDDKRDMSSKEYQRCRNDCFDNDARFEDNEETGTDTTVAPESDKPTKKEKRASKKAEKKAKKEERASKKAEKQKGEESKKEKKAARKEERASKKAEKQKKRAERAASKKDSEDEETASTAATAAAPFGNDVETA